MSKVLLVDWEGEVFLILKKEAHKEMVPSFGERSGYHITAYDSWDSHLAAINGANF